MVILCWVVFRRLIVTLTRSSEIPLRVFEGQHHWHLVDIVVCSLSSFEGLDIHHQPWCSIHHLLNPLEWNTSRKNQAVIKMIECWTNLKRGGKQATLVDLFRTFLRKIVKSSLKRPSHPVESSILSDKKNPFGHFITLVSDVSVHFFSSWPQNRVFGGKDDNDESNKGEPCVSFFLSCMEVSFFLMFSAAQRCWVPKVIVTQLGAVQSWCWSRWRRFQGGWWTWTWKRPWGFGGFKLLDVDAKILEKNHLSFRYN